MTRHMVYVEDVEERLIIYNIKVAVLVDFQEQRQEDMMDGEEKSEDVKVKEQEE
jgi:hypothetical protein